jgi:large subunit ribosomal protein L11
MSKPGKPVQTVIKLQITAGKANPAPPIGPALGQHGVNIMEFCKAYNEATRDKGDTVIPVEITVYKDKTFSFKLKTPPVGVLILKTLGLSKGSANPNTNIIGTLSQAQLEEIATTKMEDLNAFDMEAAKSIVAGSARSMGVKVAL